MPSHADATAAVPDADRALIEAFAQHLLLERHLSVHTVAAYRGDLTHLAVFLHRGHLDLGGC